MSITLPLIASLLFILSQATEFERNIDFDRCKIDTTCFVRQTCTKVTNANADTLVAFAGGKEDLNTPEKTCDAVIQIKALSKNKYHVMMQVESDQANYDTTVGFGLSQAGVTLFHCKDQGDKPEVHQDWQPAYEGKHDGKNPDLQNTMMFCSFVITKPTGKIAKTFMEDKFDSDFPIFKYKDQGTDKELKYVRIGSDFGMQMKVTCNGDMITSAAHSDAFIELIEADTTKTPMTCTSGKIRVEYDSTIFETTQVDCDDVTNQWSWDVIGRGKISAQLTTVAKVSCIEKKHCDKCNDPDPACDDKCPTPTIEMENGCKILKCPENSFVTNLDKNNMKIDNGVKCKKNEAGTAAWFTDETKEVTEVSCRTTIPFVSTTLNVLPNPTTESAAKEDSPSGADAGLIAGAVVGTIAVLGVIGGVVYFFKVHKKRKAGATSKGAPASSTKASNKKSSEKSKSKSAEVRAKDKKESGSSGSSEKPSGVPTVETPKEPAKAEETPKDKVETPGATPAATAPATPATPATPAAAPAAAAAAAPKSNPDDQTANAPV